MNSIMWPWGSVTGFTGKVVCVLLALVALQPVTKPAFSTQVPSPSPVRLEKIRGWHHPEYSSIVFQFESTILFDEPVVRGAEAFLRLKNVTTDLASFQEYKTLESSVALEEASRDLIVRIGLPQDFVKLTHYELISPYRLVVRLYTEEKASPSLSQKPGPEATEMPEPPAMKTSQPQEEATRETPQPPSAESEKTPPPVKRDETVSTTERSEAVDRSPAHGLITLNFYQSDIREVLSALAMEQTINIAVAQDVSGKVSVHLYQVTLDQALDAITLAGGFTYKKQGDLYYVYKPKAAQDPQAESLQMQIFKLKYAEIDKVLGVLEGIPGIRLIKIHEPSKTIVVEDTLENIEKIKRIINCWDRIPQQVMIEAKILEVTLTDDMSLGVNWEKILGDARIGTGGFSAGTMATADGVSPVPSKGPGVFANFITGAGTSHQFAIALNALQSKTTINTLSTPKILAIHGKTAKVQVGGQQGYKVTTVSGAGIATETIEFIDTGTILEITPYIDDEGNVLLNVKPSINSARIEEGIPVVTSTAVSTWLMARNGETVFIGGLIQKTKSETREMIPCLGGIPGLGALFGRKVQGIGKSELVVLITPEILTAEVKPGDHEARERTKQMEESFKKYPLPTHKQILDFLFP